jgi:rod shape-determining protein MreB
LPSGRYGLDLGTMNFRLVQTGRGVILNEKNMIAVRRKKEIAAAGNAAYEMFERTPPYLHVTFPVQGGVIADSTKTARTAENLLKKAGVSSGFLSSSNKFYIAAPSDISEVEKRAYFNVISRSSYSTNNIFLVEKPIAAAVGEDIPVRQKTCNMIVDMGAGSTEITVISMGGIVVTHLIPEGGNTINEEIIRNVSRRCRLQIGFKTAEYLKLELGTAIPRGGRELKVYGRDRATGLPGSADIPEGLVFESMKTYLVHVVREIRRIMHEIPPELAADINGYGIHFTGGTSTIAGLDVLISSLLNVRGIFSENPLESAARGLARICDSPNDYVSMMFSLKDSRYE